MRYDDRETLIESDDRVLFEQMEAESKAIQEWADNVAQIAFEIYNPESEYLDEDWIDKNNW